VLFHIVPKDNESYMAGSCDRVDLTTGVPICGTCGYRTDPDFTSPIFRLRKKRFDVSCCYDGAVIVSDRFRAAYRSLGGSNMRFVNLPGTPGFYHLKCGEPISLDYSAMGTRRLRPCTGCGRHLDVIGYSHIAVQPISHLSTSELAFSDWYFGSNNEASPLILCGAGLAAALQSSGITGIDSLEQSGPNNSFKPKPLHGLA
jgi:hypothetical protein